MDFKNSKIYSILFYYINSHKHHGSNGFKKESMVLKMVWNIGKKNSGTYIGSLLLKSYNNNAQTMWFFYQDP